MRSTKHIAAVGLAALTLAAGLASARADAILTGVVKDATGAPLGGVTVSAKARGATITTTVYTDEAGAYYFPALPGGAYQVWTNALGFEQARGDADVRDATAHRDFALAAITDKEALWKQLPGEEMLAALPETSEADANIKRIFRNNCTGCHTPNYLLQNRFDEAGWSAIIDLMKKLPGTGVYSENLKANALIEYNQKELAAYLARVRGPGESEAKPRERARPTGEAARAVFREYDLPQNPDAGIGLPTITNDGSNWSEGAPSKQGGLVHDAWLDLDGDLWFTCNNPNRLVSIGHVNGKTGEVKFLKVTAQNGLAANSHGLSRDKNGVFWFDINPSRRSLGRLDPKTGEIKIFATPASMSPLGGAVTVDVDGKGKIWASAPDGALRFDPETEKFTEFKSPTYKTPGGDGMTYGAAGDRDGNGWWAQMPIDVIGKADMATMKASEVPLPEVAGVRARQTQDAMKVYATYDQLSFNHPLPWQEGPRRMGTDKNDDVLWVGNSWGGSLARINTKTNETTIVPLPDPFSQQPYHIAVDSRHNAWGNLWSGDQIYRYDPAAGKWTMFDLPRRGTEVRYISLDETGGQLKVVTPLYRTSQISVMTIRSESDMEAAKKAAQ
jgi:streptogramin lyase/mono/diheme cytochrome c family protein